MLIVRICLLLSLIFPGGAFQASQHSQPKRKSTMIVKIISPSGIPEEKTLKAISPSGVNASRPPDRAPAVAEFPSMICPFGNESRNSRSEADLGEGIWEKSWEASVRTDARPKYVLVAGNRIVVEAEIWQMYDLAGKPIEQGKTGSSHIYIDRKAAIMYYIDGNGYINSVRTGDGKKAFVSMAGLADEGVYKCIVSRESKLFIGSSERQMDPHGGDVPERSLFELIDAGTPLKTDDSGLLLSAKSLGSLEIPESDVQCAIRDNLLVSASGTNIVVADLKLLPARLIATGITIKSLSLDELGRIYVVGKKGDSHVADLMNAEGGVLYSCRISDICDRLIAPPMVNRNHEAFLLSPDRVVCISNEGKELWDYKAKGKIAGGMLSADDWLLITDGNEVMALNAHEQARSLFHSENAPFLTPPALTEAHSIAVATAQHLMFFSLLKKP